MFLLHIIIPVDLTPLGDGRFGEVYLADYTPRRSLSELFTEEDPVHPQMTLDILPAQPITRSIRKVAVKKPNPEVRSSDELLFEFIREIKVCQVVGKHANIVEFIGCVATRTQLKRSK